MAYLPIDRKGINYQKAEHNGNLHAIWNNHSAYFP